MVVLSRSLGRGTVLSSLALAFATSTAVAALAADEQAQPLSIRALFPGGPEVKQTIGQTCTIKWETSPGWTNMEIMLMTGSNTDMKPLVRVAHDIDASRVDHYEYQCPEVDPKSSIYFYQFNQQSTKTDGPVPAPGDKVWTSRFALVGNDQVVAPAEHANQPDGQPVSWGTGRLVNGNADTTHWTSPTALAIKTEQHSEWLTWNPQPTMASPFPATTTSTQSPGFTNAVATGLTGFHPSEPCSKDHQCPETHPCCSEHGFCGTGRSCLNGCNPLWSFKPNACAPVAACQPQNMTFKPMDAGKIGNGTLWNGDAASHDWIVSTVAPNVTAVAVGNELVLQLKEGANGTSLYSTRSVWYGNVTARIRSSGERGVVTSFSLISGTKDEIVWEFTGSADSASTNYFWRGKAGQTANGPELQDVDVQVIDRSANYHDYGIAWTPETITWSIDGKPVRTVTKKDTLQSNGLYSFPSTPSRIQLKIFDVDEDAPPGLQEWAGGGVNYRSETYLADGYFASRVQWVNVECFDAVSKQEHAPDATLEWTAPVTMTTTTTSATEALAWSTDDVVRLDAPALTDVPQHSPATALTQYLAKPALETAQPVNGWLAPPQPQAEVEKLAENPHDWLIGGHSLGKIKRDLIELLKRAEPVPVYAFAGINADGLVDVKKVLGETVLDKDDESVFDALPSALQATPTLSPPIFSLFPTATINGQSSGVPVMSSDSTISASAIVSGTESTSARTSSATNKTVQQGWEDLGTPAHVAIFIGAGLGALLIVTLIAWCWRTVSKSRAIHQAEKGAYAPVQDKGELLAHEPYRGRGEIEPGQELYAGGRAPEAAAPVRRPTYVGGFRPSSSASPFAASGTV
ncbi:hypothetical protein ACM66B_006329 [Microbotryomycetes sp. NB124-2]